LRKGRFDEVFWVDLPTAKERKDILWSTMAQHGRANVAFDAKAVAEITTGFTGAELAALVPDALFTAFEDGERELTTEDLLQAAKSVVPLSKTASEKIDALRAWAKGRARPASTPETETGGTGRALDL
jgi:SpoVK/Ycf46/Vps4 family AAA+-type ATPase